jgi:hypothetical protein
MPDTLVLANCNNNEKNTCFLAGSTQQRGIKATNWNNISIEFLEKLIVLLVENPLLRTIDFFMVIIQKFFLELCTSKEQFHPHATSPKSFDDLNRYHNNKLSPTNIIKKFHINSGNAKSLIVGRVYVEIFLEFGTIGTKWLQVYPHVIKVMENLPFFDLRWQDRMIVPSDSIKQEIRNYQIVEVTVPEKYFFISDSAFRKPQCLKDEAVWINVPIPFSWLKGIVFKHYYLKKLLPKEFLPKSK